MKKFTLNFLISVALITFMHNEIFSQNIIAGKSFTLPDGTVLRGSSKSAIDPKMSAITPKTLDVQTSTCPIPVWSVVGSGKVIPCNSPCMFLRVSDSLDLTPSGHSTPGNEIEIGPMDGQQCTQLTIVIYLNGTASWLIGANTSLCPSCIYLGTLASWFGPGICAVNSTATIAIEHRNPTTTIEYRAYTGGSSYPWKIRDLATASIAGSGTFSGTSSTTTGVFSKANGINKGTATFICPSCPVGSYTDYKSGDAQFCPSALKPGKYGFNYTWNDGIGCISTFTDTITITTSNNASWAPSGAICTGQNYNLTNFVTGNAGGVWSASSGVSGSTFNPPTAGNYNVTYTVGSGSCAISVTKAINVGAKPVVTTSASPAQCSNNVGSFTLTATAAGTNTYTWSTTATGASTTVTPVSSTTYTVTVNESAGCSNTQTVTATINNAPSISTSAITNVLCKGNSTGAITTTITSGSSPFTYSWSNGTTSSGATGLPAGGPYVVTVTDSKGCTSITSATINQPASPIAVSTTATPTSCGTNTGTASATGTGGTGVITYKWNPGNLSGATIGTLAANTYTVTATDANNCAITATATVNPPAGGPVITVSPQTNVKCNGAATGSAYTTATGGSGNYSISWSTSSSTSPNIINVVAGNYTVTYTDLASNCSNSKTVIITQPAAYDMNDSVTNILCKGTLTGSILISPTGNNPTYTYDWSPINKQTEDITGLAPNIYTLIITDSQGCTGTFNYTITQPATGISTSATAVQTTCGASVGSATASSSGGTGTTTYSWNTNGTTATISSLASGTYTVTATDANGCSSTTTANVANANGPSVTVTSTDATCGQSNGSALATVTGTATPFVYTWSPSGGNSATASNLASGTYVVIIKDANNCSTSGTATITSSGAPVVSFTSTQVPGGPLTATFANTTTGGTIYIWSFGDPASGTNNTSTLQNPTHIYATDGTYNACLIAISLEGCKDTLCSDVIFEEEYSIEIPNVFSPNGDTKNEIFSIKTGGVEKIDVSIFDRWGLKVAEIIGATPDNDGLIATWDGRTASGSSATDGTYYYLLKAHALHAVIHEYQGFVTLVR